MQQHPTIAIIIDDVHTDLVLCCEMKKGVSARERLYMMGNERGEKAFTTHACKAEKHTHSHTWYLKKTELEP